MQKRNEFSAEELDLLSDQELILRKRALLEKIESKLLKLGKESQANYTELTTISPPCKLSRGDNLKAFPFRVLDFPRFFEKEHILAIRTLIWCGKSCTITLHLKGRFLKEALPQLQALKTYSQQSDLKLSWHGNEWEHDLTAANYAVFSEKQVDQLRSATFLKIAVALPLDQLNELDHFYQFHFKKLISLTPYGT